MREFTHPDVLAAITAGDNSADPTMNPQDIDWDARQSAAAIPFDVVDGRPVKPGPSTGITRGRNELGHWGEQRTADAIVLVRDLVGRRRILMVQRSDGHGWALPGGSIEPGETALAAGIRELREETGLVLPGATWSVWPARLVPDPRASDESWMVTTPIITDIRSDTDGFYVRPGIPMPDQVRLDDWLPAVTGGSDARKAMWLLGDSLADLETLLEAVGESLFPAHRGLLADVLTRDPDWVAARGPVEGRRWFKCRHCRTTYVGGAVTAVSLALEAAAARQHETACDTSTS